jgi:hypothetical protein
MDVRDVNHVSLDANKYWNIGNSLNNNGDNSTQVENIEIQELFPE